MKKSRNLFPSLRCRMGATIYYVTFMTFRDIDEWIKPTDEVHQSKKLSDWIQRQLIKVHAKDIAHYLLTQRERFFNAIVVGVYGGDPSWSPLDVSSPPGQGPIISDSDREFLEASIGILQFTGDEDLFAIDGQHRVEGIKKSVRESEKMLSDEIVAIFVGHETSAAGKRRTRRLFTTLNKTARRVSEADRVALDEDDGFAVVTRRLVNEFSIFQDAKFVAFAGSASLPKSDQISITTIINLYHQTCDLYYKNLTPEGYSRKSFKNTRPPTAALEELYAYSCEYWKLLKGNVPQLLNVLNGRHKAGEFRKHGNNHLLFRPVGQRAFVKAVTVLVERGAGLALAVERLCGANLWIHTEEWHEILWDPVRAVMLKNATLASTFLLRLIGEAGKTPISDKKLDELLALRSIRDRAGDQLD